MLPHFVPSVFPVPRLLEMEGGGIEISDTGVKYFRFEKRDKVRRIAAFGEMPLPPGVIEKGDIIDSNALAGALARVRALCGFSFVHASLPEQKGYLFDLALPRDSETPLRESVELALQDHVPLAPAETVFDCETVAAESSPGVRSVVVTAFPETVAQSYVNAFLAAGFVPLSLELEPQAASRAILRGVSMRDTRILADFGSGKTILSVVQSGSVRFTTSFEGTRSLDEKLASHAAKLGVPEQNIQAEVERIKYEEGLSPDSTVLDEVMPAAKALAAGIERVQVYWQSRATRGERRDKIKSVLLYGGNANLRGLTSYISKTANVSCEPADLRVALGGGEEVPPISKDRSFRYATVAGLALRSGLVSIW